jgi:type I restriction enzyme S subunit
MSPEGSRSSYKLVEPGNFVISLRSFQGGLELSRYRGIVSPAYTVLTEKLPIKREFYRLYFKTHQAISSLDSSVIGIRDGKQISYESFKHIEIPYPSVNEQEAIAQTVSIFERELHLLEKKLAITRNIKSYLLNNLITGTIRTPEALSVNT